MIRLILGQHADFGGEGLSTVPLMYESPCVLSLYFKFEKKQVKTD